MGCTQSTHASARPQTDESKVASEPFEERLRRFYEQYLPHRVFLLPVAAVQFAGWEEYKMRALVKEYGPEPATESSSSDEQTAQMRRQESRSDRLTKALASNEISHFEKTQVVTEELIYLGLVQVYYHNYYLWIVFMLLFYSLFFTFKYARGEEVN